MTIILRSIPLWRFILAFAVAIALVAVPGSTPDLGFAGASAQDDDDGDDSEGDDGSDADDAGDDDGGADQSPVPSGSEDDDGDDGGEDNRVAPAATYLVAVACAYVPADDQSTCGFAGLTEAGTGDIGAIVVPASTVCAPVVGGVQVETEDPTGDTGYGSPADAGGVVTLILTGEVRTDGSATYWVTTGESVQPATGPGLACPSSASTSDTGDDAGVDDGTGTPTDFEAEVSDTTGAVEVQAYTCGDVPDPAAIDWFEACDPAAPGIDLTLTGVGKETPPLTGTTGDTGQVVFGELSPGTYELTETDGAWCHAESDSVDAEGNVTVGAGERATVWIFHCD